MPTQDPYGQNVNLVSLTDAPDMAKAISDLAAGVIPRGVMRFASASARGAAIPTPEEGMVTYLLDSNTFQLYNGSAWVTPEPSLVTGTTGLSATAGWSVNYFNGVRQGRVTSIDFYMTRTGANLTPTNGNINDVVAATVPTSWRPTHAIVNACWDSGFAHGGFILDTNGVVTVRTASYVIETGHNLRFQCTFLRTVF
jgi:hypothetical protein